MFLTFVWKEFLYWGGGMLSVSDFPTVYLLQVLLLNAVSIQTIFSCSFR